jgi:hypothetical protein
MSNNSLSQQDIKNSTELNIHLSSEAIPEQMMINKSIEGRFSSISTEPIGQNSNFTKNGNSSMKFRITNGDMVDLSTACICGSVKVSGDGDVPANTFFSGMHTLFDSVSIYMRNKPFVSIKRGADRCADLVLKLTSTNDEFLKYTSMFLYHHEVTKDKVYSFRVPLSLFAVIKNILPTNQLTASIDVELDLNTDIKKLLYTSGAGVALADTTTITVNKVSLQADYVRINKNLSDRYMSLIRGNTGLSIPFNTYALDIRSVKSASPNFTEYIPVNYENMISILQTAYPVVAPTVNLGVSYYDKLSFTQNADINDVTDYLVNFDSSQFFNLDANKGQSFKSNHSEALNRIIDTYEDNNQSSGSRIIHNINTQQALCVSFLRSSETKSPYIANSGINGRLLSGVLTTSANLGTQDFVATNTLNSLIKFTRKIIFRDGNLDVTN